MTSQAADVVVIGAGISGLTAARYLLSKDPNLQVLVLEGKDRVGGRTLSVDLKTEHGTDTWDIGAQWVGRCQTHVMDLLEELKLQTHPQYLTGKKFLQVGKDNSVRSYSSDIPTLSLLGLLDLDRTMKRIDSYASQVDTDDPYACLKATDWDVMTLGTFINQTMWTQDAKDTLRVAITAVLGVDTSQISFLYFLMYVSSAGGLKNLVEATPFTAQEMLVKGGTQQISKIMAKEIGEKNIILREGVISISQVKGHVQLVTETGNTYTCQKAVLAIPPSQIGKIKFDPYLPTVNKELIKRMPMANYVKFIMTYKQAFWREDGKSGEAVTTGGAASEAGCSCGPLCFTYDDTSHNGNPALVAFMGGTQAVEWRQVEYESRKAAVLKSLSEFFGESVFDYIDYIEKDWDQEPYTEGAPVCCVGPGAMRFFTNGLRKPLGNVHMAGTETATVWCGYMSGAVQAGRRAAIEILLDLRPQLVTMKELEDNNKRDKQRKS